MLEGAGGVEGIEVVRSTESRPSEACSSLIRSLSAR